MARYGTRARKTRANDDYYYEPTFVTSVTVIEAEPEYTGLIDQHGNDIVRLANPIGFGRDDEW